MVLESEVQSSILTYAKKKKNHLLVHVLWLDYLIELNPTRSAKDTNKFWLVN